MARVRGIQTLLVSGGKIQESCRGTMSPNWTVGRSGPTLGRATGSQPACVDCEQSNGGTRDGATDVPTLAGSVRHFRAHSYCVLAHEPARARSTVETVRQALTSWTKLNAVACATT
jgi:hypothetical protein